jgi:hypothetical protein
VAQTRLVLKRDECQEHPEISQARFTYHSKDASFEIRYEAYLQGSLQRVMSRMAANTTHVAFSFGAWHKWRERNPVGPDMRWVCAQLLDEHPYRLVWMAPPPYRHQNGKIISVNPPHRPYNVAARCNLTEGQYIDRFAIVQQLEPDVEKQTRLFLARERGRSYHFREDSNHAFNLALLQWLAEAI